jgi:hypothetical protein
MDQQSLASNPLSSYWSSAHPVISILDVLEQNSKLSRHDLLKVRFRFITRTLMWDYRYLQIYYWTPIPGTVALRMWKRVDDWIKEKNYKLTPIEEAAYKQSRNRRVPLAAPGLFIPFLTAFAYTFATRRLRWFNYSYWTRWIVTLTTSITITPMWFSFSMGCSMTPFFTLPRDSILGMKFRELLREMCPERVNVALRLAPRDTNIAKYKSFLAQKPPPEPIIDVSEFVRKRAAKQATRSWTQTNK